MYACLVLNGLAHDQKYHFIIIILYFCASTVHRQPPALEMTPFEN